MGDGPDTARRRRRRWHAVAFRAAAMAVLMMGSAAAWYADGGTWFGTADAAPAADGDADSRAVAGDGCAGLKRVAPRELRGMTITTVYNIDWPSKPGLPVEQIKGEYRDWLDLAVRMNHNAVFVHVRPSGDALWPSQYVPWSHWLTGTSGGPDPGWDPMEFLVSETHARNLEFHAWFNPYKASQEGTIADLPEGHPLREHPEWAVPYPSTGPGRRLYYNPGIPAARAFVEDSMLEAVARYDIDAVFFDDFFYPYPADGEEFDDADAYEAFRQPGQSRAEWRRDNVDLLVREMGERITALKPWVKFGISPFGIWRNKSTDSDGSATRGLESYSAIYADTRRWVREGWLDYIVPQLYWHIGFDVADYAILVAWWSDVVTGTQVQLYTAHADYRIGESGAWDDPAEIDRQLALNDGYAVQGSMHFSANHVRANKRGAVERYRAAHYATPALMPTMAQLPAARPDHPSRVTVHRAGDSATVIWTPPRHGPRPARYAVYRADGPDATAHLVATVPATDSDEHRWVDHAPGHAYCVTALDRLWNESR